MRQLKFRIWNKFFKTMTEPKKLNIDAEINQYFLDKIPHHDFELMQFTGFYDYNNKEIYEGDILEYVSYMRDENKRREVVEFDEKCGGWYVNKQASTLADVLFEQHNEEWQKSRNYKPSLKHKIKIIGNIYENPELLTSC